MPTVSTLHCCASPGCPHLTSQTYCLNCAVDREHGRPNFNLRRLYRTARWRSLRSLVLQEEPTCPECMHEGFITPSLDVHHTEKATDANFFNRDILQALCHPHHAKHTQQGD